jgi:hypothetical protein
MSVPGKAWAWLIVLAASIAGAQADSTPLSKVPAFRRRLIGIYDSQSGDPVAGVRISDVLSGVSMVTSRTGTAALIFVPEGVRILRLQKLGYEVQTFPLSIIESDTSSLTMTMRRATELAAMITTDSASSFGGAVSARLQAWERRRKSHNGGYFVGADVLRKADGQAIATVLTAQLPGLALDRRFGNKTMVVQSPRCMDGTKSGPPAVYLDGVAFTEDVVEGQRARRTSVAASTSSLGTSSEPPVDIQRVSVEEIAAVEWYPDNSLLPPDVPHNSGRCGALLLWTRER